jgi:hypothetical protein
MGAKFDVSAALRVADTLRAVPKKMEQAKQRAIATLVRRLPPEANRDIREEYNLTASRVRAGLTVRAVGDAVELTGSGVGIGLAQYGARQTKAGVTAQIRKDGGRELFRHAFIRAPGGRAAGTGRQVFERQSLGSKRAPRYPLDRIYSQNIAGMLRNRARAERLAKFSMDVLTAEIQRQLGVLA